MSNPNTISIIIPVYNEAFNLGRLIPFLNGLEKKSIVEIIVVDGGSIDGSQSIAKDLGATLINCSECCRATQLNLGAVNAIGSILYFLHADSFPIDSLVEDINEAKLAGFPAGCYRFEFDSPKIILKINSWFTRFNGVFSGGGDQSLFIEKSFFNKQGGYDEKFTIMEDFELVKRIKKVSKFKVIPKSIKVSARKYQANSWLSVQWANFAAMTAFHLGMKPEKIKNLYYSRIK